MGFPVYDFRNPEHITNMLVTPEIRSRFMWMDPGDEFNSRHSHDLGHEIFLVLQGKMEFEIDGETEILEPGQLCYALRDQPHAVRVIGDEPVVIYLSVTPHILPTHTGRTQEGEALPIRFSPHGSYDVPFDETVTRSDRVERHRSAVDAFAQAAQALVDQHREVLSGLAASESEDQATRNAMWEKLYHVHRNLTELNDSWNDLAPTLTEGTK
tara:strand:+ start:2080 stop:2715 length:636 start_codon:yes stop_codon:yes gene_type:complete